MGFVLVTVVVVVREMLITPPLVYVYDGDVNRVCGDMDGGKSVSVTQCMGECLEHYYLRDLFLSNF